MSPSPTVAENHRSTKDRSARVSAAATTSMPSRVR